MKRIAGLLVSAFLYISPALAAPSQVEFTAALSSIENGPSQGGLLILDVTPQIELQVRVTASTEIKSPEGFRILLSDLQPGMLLTIEGIFTDAGILAQEVKIDTAERDFELRGPIQALDAAGRSLQVLGFPIQVPSGAEIRDAQGNGLLLQDLSPGDLVKVEGRVLQDALSARQITAIQAGLDFAQIRFTGTVASLTNSQVDVLIEGVGAVPVTIDSQTIIRGDLVEGALVEVEGRLNPDLSVLARRIRVERPFEAVPDELRLAPGQTGRVDLVLRAPLNEDATFTLLSRAATVAVPSVESLTIAAGSLSAAFEVQAANREGETAIVITSSAVLGGAVETLRVEVEDDGQDDFPQPELTEIKWSPDKLNGPAGETVEVALQLTRTVATDLTVDIFLKDGPADLVSFPDQAVIPAGERLVRLQVGIGTGMGRARVRAALPAEVGGDTDDLEVELRPDEQEKLEISWAPDEIEMGTEQSRTVRLTLDRPAPVDFIVSLTLRKGDASLVEGLPSEVLFSAGESSKEFVVRSGSRQGEAEYRASAPFSLGADTDDLKIEIENR